MASRNYIYTLFMIEIACSVLSGMPVATGSIRELWAHSGDVRATFTYPFEVEIVEVYRTGTEILLGSGEMLICMLQPYDRRRESPNHMGAFFICVPESLQARALAALIQQDIRRYANPLRRHVCEWLSEN